MVPVHLYVCSQSNHDAVPVYGQLLLCISDLANNEIASNHLLCSILQVCPVLSSVVQYCPVMFCIVLYCFASYCLVDS